MFCYTNLLNDDLSGGYRYPSFEQPGPIWLCIVTIRFSLQESVLQCARGPPWRGEENEGINTPTAGAEPE